MNSLRGNKRPAPGLIHHSDVTSVSHDVTPIAQSALESRHNQCGALKPPITLSTRLRREAIQATVFPASKSLQRASSNSNL